MKLKIDHVTIAGPELSVMQDLFVGLGMAADYGGAHSNGITHMALVGFDDGSYIELISKLESGQVSPLWDLHIEKNGGACAWAVEVDDVAAEVARIASLGINVKGPFYLTRKRPDGLLVEWDLAFLGDLPPGAKLPFIIKDRTPRQYRVRPSASVTGRELIGVRKIILAVEDLDDAISLFKRVYEWSDPQITEIATFQARLAFFADRPLILASPLNEESPLAERLSTLGESPCAFLIGSNDLESTKKTFKLKSHSLWFGHHISWVEPERLNNTWLGFIRER